MSSEGCEPSIVLIGVPNTQALERVMRKLKKHHIIYEVFFEPDYDIGLSALATYPLSDEQRDILRKYCIWREDNVTYKPEVKDDSGE